MIYVCITSILLDTWHSLYRNLLKRIWITFADNFVLRMFDFGGRWSMTDPQKNGAVRRG